MQVQGSLQLDVISSPQEDRDPHVQGGARTIVIMRHGETDWNLLRRWQGQTDIPLNTRGLEQAAEAAPIVAALNPDLILSSTLSRAQRTAEYVAEESGMQVLSDPRLVETDLGSWEGMRDEDVEARFPGETLAWLSGVSDARAGEHGETREEVAARCLEAVREYWGQVEADSVMLVVMHGGAARALTGALLDLDPQDWAKLEGLGNCNWTVLQENRLTPATRGGGVEGRALKLVKLNESAI